MENKIRGVLIIGLGITFLGGLLLMLCSHFDEKIRLHTQQPSNLRLGTENQMDEKTSANPLMISESVDKWKNCRNTKVGYEVKYPNDWNTYARGPMGNLPEECNTTRPQFVISPEDQYNAEKANFVIDYRDTTAGLGQAYSGSRSLEEYLQKLPYGSGEIFKETLIEGRHAVWIKDNDYTSVLTFNNDTVFIIMQKNIAPESFDHFLSTFKFLK